MRRLALIALSGLAVACPTRPAAPPTPPSPEPVPMPSPSPVADAGLLPVTKAKEEVIVAAWSEPKELPPEGGKAQIVIRLTRRGGKPYPDVETRLRTSAGRLYSKGQILTTGPNGMTRDQLTTRHTATITLNAGGTIYRFQVPVAEPSPEPTPLPSPSPAD